MLKSDNVWVSGRTERSFAQWKELGAHTTLDNGEVVQKSEVIFLAIKPQMLDDALRGIKIPDSRPAPGRLFISVLVGVTTDVLQSVSKPELKQRNTYAKKFLITNFGKFLFLRN